MTNPILDTARDILSNEYDRKYVADCYHRAGGVAPSYELFEINLKNGSTHTWGIAIGEVPEDAPMAPGNEDLWEMNADTGCVFWPVRGFTLRPR